MAANRTGQQGAGRSGAEEVAARYAQQVRTNYEFGQELGATGYAQGGVAPAGRTASTAQQTGEFESEYRK